MNWELLEVTKERECIMDDSGIYTVINFTKDRKFRVDLMTVDDEPVISWISDSTEALRKEILTVLSLHGISIEHASYIGSELAKLNLLKSRYVQD